MTAVFEKILEMSATASVVIVVVMAIRLLLRKAPRKYSYALWAVAGFRLVCPVSFRSMFSIFTLTGGVKLPAGGQTAVVPPVTAVTPPAVTFVPDVIATAPPAVVTTPPAISVTPPVVTEPITDPVSFWGVASVVWLVVLAGLLIYGAVSYARLCRRMASAVVLEGNVYRSDRVRSPFILGFIRPKIYLPFGLTEEQQTYVLSHERYHIRRLDHIIRPVAFLILAVHWFNPLVWLGYYMMGRDMEMSCDEKVLGGGQNIRKAYSLTLLSFAANRRFPSPSPLAFGETGVKGRIRNILNWKKPRLWVTVAAVIVVAAVLVSCAANPSERKSKAGIWEWMSTVTAEDVRWVEAGMQDTHGLLSDEQIKVLTDKLNAVPEDALKKAGTPVWQITLTINCGDENYVLRLAEDALGVSHGGNAWLVEDEPLDTVARGIAADVLGWELVFHLENYETAECLYLHPAASFPFVPDWGVGTPHQIGKTHIIAYASFDIFVPFPERMGAWEPLTAERWESMFTGEHPLPYSTLSDPMIRSAGQGTWLMQTGEELWLLDMHDGDPDKVWAVFCLERAPEVSFEAPTGWYRSVECVYMSPLSSSIPMNGDSGYTYGIEGDALTVVHNGSLPTLWDSTGHSFSYRAVGGWEALTEDMWREMTEGTLFLSGSDLWDTIGQYRQRYIRRYEAGYFLLGLDGEIWVGESAVHPNGEPYLWDLWRLTAADAPVITVENKATFTADLNHDGSFEFLTVSYDHVNETYNLTVAETMGMNILLEWQFHRMENLSGGYYLYTRDGKDYLLWWEPYCQQGVWQLYYEVISFDEKGGHVVLEQDERNYDDSHLGDSHLTADLDDLRAFEREINSLLADATPLLVSQTANNGSILIGGEADLWKSPADDWEDRRQYEQGKQTAREKATLAVWPLNDLTVTLLGEGHGGGISYTLDVFGKNNYFFWETRFDRLSSDLLYFRYEEGGVQYLMELSIGGGQGIGNWSYRIFSVGPESLDVIRTNSLYFDSATHESMLAVDTDALRAFEGEVNDLLAHAHLIGGISNSKLVYNTPDSITTVYRMDTGHADRIEGLQKEAAKPEPTPEPTPAPTQEPSPEPTPAPDSEWQRVTSAQLPEGFKDAAFDAYLDQILQYGGQGHTGRRVSVEFLDLTGADSHGTDGLYRVIWDVNSGEATFVCYIGFHGHPGGSIYFL